MDAATKVRDERKRLDLSVETLARMSRVSQSTIKRIESGDSRVDVERVSRVLAALEEADVSIQREKLPERLQRLAMEMLAISARMQGNNSTGYVADDSTRKP